MTLARWTGPVFVLACLALGCSSSPTSSGVDLTDDLGSAPVSQLAAATPSAAAATPAPVLVDMIATITNRKNPTFSSFSCDVEVNNPSSVTRTGKVTVTFVHAASPGPGADAGSPPQTQEVVLPPGGKQQLTFKDTIYHFFSEDATVEITTDPVGPPSAAPTTTTPGAYPSPPPGGYGNTN